MGDLVQFRQSTEVGTESVDSAVSGRVVLFDRTSYGKEPCGNTCDSQPCDSNSLIDFGKLEIANVRRQLDPGLVKPSVEDFKQELAGEHTAEPIKDVEDILRISQYLISHKRYRDNMLFIVGINFGLRVSDLLQLRFSMILDQNLNFRTSFPILEKKTSNTRKHKRNRYITINDAAVEAITLYLRSLRDKGETVHMDDFLFRGESNRCGSGKRKAMSRMSVDRILKNIAEETSIKSKVSTHTLRKTFGYHQMVMSGNDPRKLLLLQKMFGHSTAAQTLDYIGITNEEIVEAYKSLNLGSVNYYKKMGDLEESAM